MTPSGVITEFPIPTAGSYPSLIVAGPDGNLWFTELHGNKIGRITTSGVITEFPVTTSFPDGITVGPDGNLWFALEGFRPDLHLGAGASIGRITTAGVVTEFPGLVAGSVPVDIEFRGITC
jgi:virginiamycin B lyase